MYLRTRVCILYCSNFKRPMAVQDKKNEQHYIDNYNVSILKRILRRGHIEIVTSERREIILRIVSKLIFLCVILKYDVFMK